MTTHTTKRTCPRVVIQRLRFGDFVLRNSTEDAMTIFAVQTLIAIVLLVTEAYSERARHLGWACIAAELMAHATGGNVATALL
jgi:hypothetical protein